MSESIFKKSEVNSTIHLIELLQQILDGVKEITEFSDRELKAISILETDPFFKEYLEFYISNKKHVKRKHSKELLEALRAIASTMIDKTDHEQRGWFRR